LATEESVFTVNGGQWRSPMLALAVGTFAIGTTEFVIVGLLPEVADDLSVSLATAGLLVSGYAFGVAAGAPVLTSLGAGLPPKLMLLALMAIFIAGNVLCAVAGSFGLLMVGRLVSSLTHGAFFGIGAVTATELVPRERRARAVATMFTGLTAATVLGVPLGTALGHAFGWRSTFWVVAGLGTLACLAIAILVPFEHGHRRSGVTRSRELDAFRTPGVWLLLGISALTSAALFASLTYLAPLLEHVAGVPGSDVSWLLLLFGAGLVCGNQVGSRLADRNLRRTLLGALAALVVTCGLFALVAGSAVLSAIAIFALGSVVFTAFVPNQILIMDHAGEAPTLASAVNIGAANLGNAAGALIAGAIVGAGLSYRLLPVAGGVLALLSLALALVAIRAIALPRPAEPKRSAKADGIDSIPS
jgi:DHA1 family inner membrane transport protein